MIIFLHMLRFFFFLEFYYIFILFLVTIFYFFDIRAQIQFDEEYQRDFILDELLLDEEF